MSTADWWRLLVWPLGPRSASLCVLIGGRGLCWCAPLCSTNHQPFPFLRPLTCYANDIGHVLKLQKGTKLLKTVHFWRTFRGFHFVNPFSIKNVCSLDHKALYMCLKQHCAPPFMSPLFRMKGADQRSKDTLRCTFMQVCPLIKTKKNMKWLSYQGRLRRKLPIMLFCKVSISLVI